VVAVTGAAITNHTISRLIGLCDSKAYVVALGDSTPLTPVLFDHGLDAICGTRVVDPETVLRCVGEGANFRQIRGVRLLTMIK
jgi:uncharacterized protein (DUF4213/DUF364 family)